MMDKRRTEITDATSCVYIIPSGFTLIRYGPKVYFGQKSPEEVSTIRGLLETSGTIEAIEKMFRRGILSDLIQTEG